MKKNSTTKIYFPNTIQETCSSIISPMLSYAFGQNSFYSNLSSDVDSKLRVHTECSEVAYAPKTYVDSTIELVAQWFLSLSSMSNKKLQKLCYYAYCWFIVFNND